MATDKTYKIFIVDDHPVVVDGLSSLINHLPEMKVCGSAENGRNAIAGIQKSLPDVALLDINLPDMSGIELCKAIRQQFPQIKILAISTYRERSYISRMIENGASGYLTKNASHQEIAEAIKTVLNGKLYMNISMDSSGQAPGFHHHEMVPLLTKREKEVLAYIADGYTNNQIAKKLFISPSTVDTHRKNMLTKLDVNNTAALIRVSVEKGLI